MASENKRVRVYEGMILFDSKEASSKWDAFKGQVMDIVKKHGAEILKERKWSDRRLAYEIKRVRRGTYLLVHFSADPEVILPIREDLKLAEPVLREMILKLDETPESYLLKEEAADRAEAAKGEAEAAARTTATEGKAAAPSPKPTEAEGKAPVASKPAG